jgi:hypothetical protein
MAIEEASGYCDYCQRPVLGRRQGLNHVVFALLSLFSCGLFLIVWAVLAILHSGDQYACPTCGSRVRAGARGPLSPADLAAANSPVPRRPLSRAGIVVAVCIVAVPLLGGLAIGAYNLWTDRQIAASHAAAEAPTTMTPRATSVLAEDPAYESARLQLFRGVLKDRNRKCERITQATMVSRGKWSILCRPTGSYDLQFNERGDLDKVSP